ncbi:MAG: hypothetical protein ABUL62_13420 [Myxococcales bacterium]|jgi:hypothetical protein
MNQNPYAPPSLQADGEGLLGSSPGDGGGLRREGDLVVIPVSGAAFPPRCVVCNESAVKRLKRRAFWHPPGYFALLVVGVWIYVIVSLIVRKRADFDVGLCQRHVERRRNGMLIGWIGSIACFIAAIATASQYPVLAVLFGLGCLGSIIAGAVMVRVVTPKRIDKQYAWLKFDKPFLDSIG